MAKNTIEQSSVRIQEYIKKIHSIKKVADEALIELIDFLKKSHSLRKELSDIFISTAEDIEDEININNQIQALLSDENTNIEHDEEINMFISSLKEFSFMTKLKRSKIDSELAREIERVIIEFDEGFHKELNPILELIADEQLKIKKIQEES